MNYFLYTFIYFIYFILSFFPDIWFFFGKSEEVKFSSVIFLIIHIFYLKFFKKIPDDFFKSQYLSIFFMVFATIGFILFPVRDLRLGDGILLLENFLLEVNAFGYTVVPDEILSGLLHSFVYFLLGSISMDPVQTYSLVSTIIGIFFLLIIYNIVNKNVKDWLLFPLFLSCGGSLLFYGYMENYTIVSFTLFLVLYWGSNINKHKNNFTYFMMIASILSGISALFHLITGFILPALVFLMIYISSIKYFNEEKLNFKVLKKFNFYKDGLIYSFPAILLLFSTYIYFYKFSSLRIDLSLAHASHPPFLNLKQIVSPMHLYDLLKEAFFIGGVFIYTFVIVFIKNKELIKKLFIKADNLFLLFALFGICAHFITYNPLLGYPADWDLMGFFWIPLFVLLIRIFPYCIEDFRKLLPLFLFGYIVLLFTLSKLGGTEKQNWEVEYLRSTISEYFNGKKDNININNPIHTKNILHTDFFLFRTEKFLKMSGESKLLEINLQLQKEFDGGNILNDRDKWKDFINKATEFHKNYLDWKKRNYY